MCHVLPPAGFVFQNPDHQVVMPTVGADVAFGLGRYLFSNHMLMVYCLQLAACDCKAQSSLSCGSKLQLCWLASLWQQSTSTIPESMLKVLCRELLARSGSLCISETVLGHA